MTLFNYLLKKLEKTFLEQKELSETELNSHEVYSDTWRKKTQCLDYVKEVNCSVFSYAGYIKAMEEITGFGMNDWLSSPGLGWKYFKSLTDETDELSYTYNNKYMRWFFDRVLKED